MFRVKQPRFYFDIFAFAAKSRAGLFVIIAAMPKLRARRTHSGLSAVHIVTGIFSFSASVINFILASEK